MKITSDNLKTLQGFVSEYLTPVIQEEYIKQGLSATRFLFDATYKNKDCNRFICDVLYRDNNMNDQHIKTALKNIAKQNGCRV